MSGGIIKRWITHDYMAVSWEYPDRRVVRLGFVHRQPKHPDWQPVAQGDALVPLKASNALCQAVGALIRYHEQLATMMVDAADPREFSHWVTGGWR